MTKKITVLGAGSWGTALALQLARNGNQVFLWGHRSELVDDLILYKENRQYLSGFLFPDNLQATHDLKSAVLQSDMLLLAIPSSGFENLLKLVQPFVAQRPIIWAIKGFEKGTGRFLSDIFESCFRENHPYALLAGPSFAKEVALLKPTAVTIVAKPKFNANVFAHPFNSSNFACYTANDIIGAQIGGAVKNVIAIATGIADGIGYGANTRAALITRGLHEMNRLALALGGKPETLTGLTGMGDLVLTATDDLSRNRRFGLGIGRAQSIPEIKSEIGQVIEGEGAAYDTWQLAQRYQVRMPITESIYRILYEALPIQEAIEKLMDRSLKDETI